MRIWADDNGAAVVTAAMGYPTKISGCHEAAETRTKRVKYMFLKDTSFQLHRE